MKRTISLLSLTLAVLTASGCGRRAVPVTPLSVESHTLSQLALLPTPPVQGTVIPPSLAGDAVAQPMEALSSDNPNERLQVVRQAQNKWGGMKVAADIDQQAIVGRWNLNSGDLTYRIFNADGTYQSADLFLKEEGTYCLLPNNRIELSCPGILYGEKVTQLEYRLLGDTLELKYLGLWIKYRKAPQ